jgi:hypothetical protein
VGRLGVLSRKTLLVGVFEVLQKEKEKEKEQTK